MKTEKKRHVIDTHNEQRETPITPKMRSLIRQAITATLTYEAFESIAEVSVTFVDSERIRELNQAFRQVDRVTDVLSFPICDFHSDDAEAAGAFDVDPCRNAVVLGDIVLCVMRAQEQAEQYGHSLERELAFLSIHSTLHLLGYDHETSPEDEADMRRRQRDILRAMGLEIQNTQ